MSTRTERVELVQITAAVASEWVQLRFQESTGFVSIASDYGHWTYHWIPAHRHDSLGHFLARIDISYAGGKFLGAGLDEPDLEATVAHVKTWILESRKDEWLAKDEARSHWESLEYLEVGDLDGWLRETEIPDAWDSICTRMVPGWTNFWEHLWLPEIRPALAEWPEDKGQARDYERALREGDANGT